MSEQFTELTDKVLQDVMKHDIVTPALYSERFNYHAKLMNLDVDVDSLVSQVIESDLYQANLIIAKSKENLNKLHDTTLNAQDAITTGDKARLLMVMDEIGELRAQIEQMQSQVYQDALTKAYNRTWMSEKFLSDGLFKENGVMLVLDIDGFKKIVEDFGKVFADKVLVYLISYLQKQSREWKIVRYALDTFIILTTDTIQQSVSKIEKAQETLSTKKIKANEGSIININFSFGLTAYSKSDVFRDVLEVSDTLMRRQKRNKSK